MAEPTQQLRGVAWGEVFPWLMLVRALRLATSAPILLAATVAVLLLPVGWRVAALLPGESTPAMITIEPTDGLLPPVAGLQAVYDPDLLEPRTAPRVQWPRSWGDFTAPMIEILPQGMQPVRHLFSVETSWREWAFFALGTFWNVLVWGFFGAIIVRTAVMQYGRGERVGLVDAGRFAARRYATYVGAPLFLLGLIATLVLLSLPAGWLMRLEFGSFLAALLWVFVLLGGLLAAVAFVGLLLGWPLLWGATSAEEMGDVFEATQRTFSYTFGRPLHYAWYALVTLLVGSLAFIVVQWFAELVVYMSLWLVSWGSGTEAIHALQGAQGWRFTGSIIVEWLSQLVLTVASAFRYAYFWCAAGVTYLLLRRDNDQTEFDVVYMPDEPARFSLPPLTTDAAGVPGVE